MLIALVYLDSFLATTVLLLEVNLVLTRMSKEGKSKFELLRLEMVLSLLGLVQTRVEWVYGHNILTTMPSR